MLHFLHLVFAFLRMIIAFTNKRYQTPRCSRGVLRTVRLLLGVQNLPSTDDRMSSGQKTESNSTLCVQHMTSVIYRALHNSVERERELEQATVQTSHTIVRAFARRQCNQQGSFQGVHIPFGTSLWWNIICKSRFFRTAITRSSSNLACQCLNVKAETHAR